MQYLFMLLRRRLSVFASLCSAAGSIPMAPKPRNLTGAGKEEKSNDLMRGSFESADARDCSGRETLTVVPRPFLLRT